LSGPTQDLDGGAAVANPRHGVTSPGEVLELRLDTAFRSVEVMNVDGADLVWMTYDGSDPVEGQDGCTVMPAAVFTTLVHPRGNPSVIKFLSDSAVRVCARGVSYA
jgi:hypothetical protein